MPQGALFGLMRERVQLQAPTRTADGQGGYTITWTTKAKVWAQVVPLSGRELLIAQQLGTMLSHNVLMRYYAGLLPSWRVLTEDGRQLNVRSVANVDERKVVHTLSCEQIIPSVD